MTETQNPLSHDYMCLFASFFHFSPYGCQMQIWVLFSFVTA